ncbi:MAG: hypothetical protein UY77_C0013G0012 [Candidatus Uhrbacteria bacterium GW2011_GWA2_53_10]|uniref:Uncharacterized protein n=1 Tax=Candidatus Uhrbacteria bacterium GW2011_GWA2_53_10 TaxID=1618980 RepID=A0A0G2AJN3_9BACT|nr:MAG: hypothetical protein UY77_C0013G0012 [Candidatus Uhrbacteria bacterium GW2011_GWA2_53_10]
MQSRVSNFLGDLDKCLERGEYRGYSLRDVNEGMAVVLAANLLVDHGIASNEVLRALKKAGLEDNAKLLALIWDRSWRETLLAVFEYLAD